MKFAIIGGSGLAQLAGLEQARRQVVRTPYGDPSGPLTHGRLDGIELVFLARHGYGHTIPPHEINYRANLWALHGAGVLHPGLAQPTHLLAGIGRHAATSAASGRPSRARARA